MPSSSRRDIITTTITPTAIPALAEPDRLDEEEEVEVEPVETNRDMYMHICTVLLASSIPITHVPLHSSTHWHYIRLKQMCIHAHVYTCHVNVLVLYKKKTCTWVGWCCDSTWLTLSDSL